jgi:[CysO sulfur-carrier protein]-S-L-cysteine hydrolase
MPAPAQLAVSRSAYAAMIAAAYDCYPEEACGLLVGRAGANDVVRFVPCENITHSARIYSIEPRSLLRAERDAEDDGLEVIGVMHSHTHTEPYPSPTDVDQAPDPTWHYVIVSLKREAPEARSYRLIDGTISEVAVAVT